MSLSLNRFKEKVENLGGHWLWQAATDSNGYGRYWFDNRMRLAHRVSYLLFVGPIPEGLDVLHTCNITSCVNPDHLKVGTHAENMKDLHKAATVKTRKIDYPEARKLRAEGKTYREIAEKFSCSIAAVQQGLKRND